MDFLNGLVSLTDWLFYTSLKAIIVIALVVIVQTLFRNKLSAMWLHALWLLVILRLVIPFEIPSPTSIFNVVTLPEHQAVFHFPEVFEPEPAQTPAPVLQVVETQPATKTTTSHPASTSFKLTTAQILSLAWFCIAIALAIWTISLNLTFHKKIKNSIKVTDANLIAQFNKCKKQMGISRIELYSIQSLESPILYGLKSPRLLIPIHLLNKLGQRDLENIFLHELAHYKRFDIPVAFLSSILQVLYWFNPVVWYAFYRMRMDREKACDELVLTKLDKEQVQEYGRTLVSLFENTSNGQKMPLAAGILDNGTKLKGRITMISNYSRKSKHWIWAPAIFLIIVTAISFTKSAPLDNMSNTWWESNLEGFPQSYIYLTEISDRSFEAVSFTPAKVGHFAIKIEGTPASQDSFLCVPKQIVLPSMGIHQFERIKNDTFTCVIKNNKLSVSTLNYTNIGADVEINYDRSDASLYTKDFDRIIDLSKKTEDLQHEITRFCKMKKGAMYYLPDPDKQKLHNALKEYVLKYYETLDHFQPEMQVIVKQFTFHTINQIWYLRKEKADSLFLVKEIQSIKEGQDGYFTRQYFANNFYNQTRNKDKYDKFTLKMFKANLSFKDQIELLHHVSANYMDDTDKYDTLFFEKVEKLLLDHPEDKWLQKMSKRSETFKAQRELKEGKYFPELEFTSLDDQKFTVSQFRGKYLFIDCWATWCKPCVEDQPDLIRLHEKYMGKQIKFISLSTDPKNTLVEYIQAKSITMEQYLVESEKLAEIGVTGYPRYFLLDPEGKILNVHRGGGMGLKWAEKEISKYIAL